MVSNHLLAGCSTYGEGRGGGLSGGSYSKGRVFSVGPILMNS